MASRRIKIVVAAYEEFLDKVVKKIVLEVVNALIASPSAGGTPVDTGWASSNWIPHVGTPVLRPAGSPTNVSDAAQQAGIASVLGYRSSGPVFVSNNVPYILRLNEGSSRQAPAGFVQAAIAKAVRVAVA